MRERPAIRTIGAHAHAALRESGGRIELFDGARDTAYARAAGHVIWIGHGHTTLHPRAVVLERCVDHLAGAAFVVDGIEPWRAPMPTAIDAPSKVRERTETLRGRVLATETPRGLAVVLRGDIPPFPLARALPDVEALALACAADDVDGACRASLPLLGLGPGLTPSGDDALVGLAAARRALARRASDAARWTRAGERLAQTSDAQAHPIAAALFRDLVAGATFAPLHRLAAAIASGCDAPTEAARELIAIGHSSGWDMLAGFLVGITGRVHESTHRGSASVTTPETMDLVHA